jgi:hypothetical protein
MARDCITRLLDPAIQQALFGDTPVSSENISRLVKYAEAIKKNAANKAEFEERLSGWIKQEKELNILQRKMKANELAKQTTIASRFEHPDFDKNPVEGFQSLLTYSRKLANNARDSADNMGRVLRAKYDNIITTGLAEKKLLNLATSKELDLEIRQEMYALKTGGEIGISKSPEALEIAKILHTANKARLQDAMDAKMLLRDLPEYTAPQTHSREKLTKAGLSEWAADVDKWINKEKTLGEIHGNQEETVKMYEKVFKDITEGSYSPDIGGMDVEPTLKVGGGRSRANIYGRARKLFFNGPEAEHLYNEKYGEDGLLLSILKANERMATDAALVHHFGNTPRDGFKLAIDAQYRRYMAAGNETAARSLKPGEGRYNKRLMDTFDQVSGNLSRPVDETLAIVSQVEGFIQNSSKLGASGLRSASNIGATFAELFQQRGGGMLRTALESMHEFGKQLKNELVMKPKEMLTQTKFAQNRGILPEYNLHEVDKLSGMFLGDMGRDVMRTMGFDSMGPIKFLNKGNELVFMLDGMNVVNKAFKRTVSKLGMKYFGDVAHLEFDKLPVETKATLLRVGIEAPDWELMRTTVSEHPEFGKMLTQSGLQDVDPSVIKERAKELNMSPDAYVRHLQTKYGQHFLFMGDQATTTATAREMSLLNLGFQQGTVYGVGIRAAARFKSFLLQSLSQADMYMRYKPEVTNGVLTQAGRNYRLTATYATLGIMGAYAADTMWRGIQGKAPKNPLEGETWIDALTKAGFAAGATDYLFTQQRRFGGSFAENMWGPTFGQIFGRGQEIGSESIHTLLTGKNLKGNKDVDRLSALGKIWGKRGAGVIRQNIPFQQFPLAKQGLDYIQYDVIQSMLDPQYEFKKQLKEFRERQGIK